MLSISRFSSLKLKSYLVNQPIKPLKSVKPYYDMNKNICVNSSNIYVGINKPYNICSYQQELDHLEDIIDFNYNTGINNKIKLDSTFHLEQYYLHPVNKYIQRNHQINIIHKIIFNQLINIPYHKDSYKFIYYYMLEGDIEFNYKTYNTLYIPKENDIICIDNNNIKTYPTYNNIFDFKKVNAGPIGILIMTISKV